MKPRVKICCISSIEEAAMAVNYGASALGLVGKMPSGPGVVADELIAEIVKTIPPPVASFLLTSETVGEDIVDHHRKVNTNTIQIVDTVSHEAYSYIRVNLPNVKIVQVVHVIDEKSIDEAVALSDFVDAVLLDSGNPKLIIKELGGTGRVHNWKFSARIVEAINKPVFLAGGLNPDNVESAIDNVRPFGLDLCSGLRTDGRLDEKKVERFMKIISKYN